MYEAKAWKETDGPSLRGFNEKEAIDSVNGALALRPQIEKIVDQIWEEGFDGIYFMGIGGTYASSMQVEVYMRGKSRLPVYVENAAEFLTTGNKRFTDRSVVIYSSVSGNTKEMVELVDHVHKLGARVIAFIDTPGSALTQPGKSEHLIVYPVNEQLKFFMLANYLMYKNGEFPEYDRYNQEMEAHLAKSPCRGGNFRRRLGLSLCERAGCFQTGASGSAALFYWFRYPVRCDLFLCDVLLGGTDVGSYKIHQLPGVFPRHAGRSSKPIPR